MSTCGVQNHSKGSVFPVLVYLQGNDWVAEVHGVKRFCLTHEIAERVARRLKNAEIIADRLWVGIKTNGGATVRLEDGSEPRFGFAVADPDCETILTAVSYRKLFAYVAEATEDGRAPFVGAWVDDGKIYLDRVRVHTCQQVAKNAAIRNCQLAYFDIGAGETIRV